MTVIGKVLTIWTGEYFGGASRRFVELTDGLARRGNKVVLISAKTYPGSSNVQVLPAAFPQGKLRTIRMVFATKSILQLKKLLREFQPDVTFCFGLVNGGILCSTAGKHKVPCLLFIRGMELVIENNPNIPFGHMTLIGKLMKWIYTFLFRAYSRKILHRADGIVFQHQQQLEAFLNENLFSGNYDKEIFFLPNNSNPTWLPPARHYHVQDNLIFIIAANLFWHKGFKVAFEAFRIVKIHEPEAQLLILGQGRDENEIRQYAKSIDGIEFKGHVPNIEKYLLSCRLLIHPTLEGDGSPNIVLEAAGIGVPMLVSDAITHTVGEYPGVYPARDFYKMAQLWKRAIKDEKFYTALCDKSLNLGKQYRFDWIEKAENILHKIRGCR